MTQSGGGSGLGIVSVYLGPAWVYAGLVQGLFMIYSGLV